MKKIKFIRFEKFTIIKIDNRYYINNFSGGENLKINNSKFYFITKPKLISIGVKFSEKKEN